MDKPRLVYQVVEPIELWSDGEHRLFVWESLEKAFGQMPIVLDKKDLDKLEGMEASFKAYLLSTKQQTPNSNPFSVLMGQIQYNGKVRVWVDVSGLRGTG